MHIAQIRPGCVCLLVFCAAVLVCDVPYLLRQGTFYDIPDFISHDTIDGLSIFHRESVGLSLHYRESSRPSLGNTE